MSFDTSQISYVSLRDIVAERTDGVVFWTGSGLSSEAGLPTWTELKCALLAALYEQIDQLDNVGSKERRRAADLIREEQNNWRAFGRLKSQLGITTWRSQIREVLRPSASANSPPIYDKLWRLRPHGILTLNLDRLTTKPVFPILGVFRPQGAAQPKRDGSIIVRSCKATQSPVYPIRDAFAVVEHPSCPSSSSSCPLPVG